MTESPESWSKAEASAEIPGDAKRPELRDKFMAAVVRTGGASLLRGPRCVDQQTSGFLFAPYFESVVNWFTVPFTPSLVPSGRVESTL